MRNLLKTVFCVGAVFLTVSTVLGKSVITFNRNEVVALSLGSDLFRARLTNSADLEPLEAIVHSGPTSLTVSDSGGTWKSTFDKWTSDRIPADDRLKQLQAKDLTIATNILKDDVMKQWLNFVQPGKKSQSAVRTAEELVSFVSQKDEATQRVMLPAIGAKIVALAKEDNECQSVVYSLLRPPAIARAITAHQFLEEQKIQAAASFLIKRTNANSNVLFETVTRDNSKIVLWKDFLPFKFGAGSEWPKTYAWTVEKDRALSARLVGAGNEEPLGKVNESAQGQINRRGSTDLSMLCIWLSKGHHIIVVGGLTVEQVRKIGKAETFSELMGWIKKWSDQHTLGVFLSRPGSSVLGVVSPNIQRASAAGAPK
ncbi:MAG: hypothetical protein JWM68_1835 [Verrucomicrobiales bacterium]|nr:hypothetical protein [Verrucomicrobiales bacterium]